MKNSACILLFFVLGCAGLPVELNYKAFPATKDAIVIRQARYISNTATDLVFEIDLYHLKGYDYGHFVSPIYFYNDYLDSTFFSFTNAGQFKFLSTSSAKATSSTPSSTVVLIDESGDYDSLDHYNTRTQGIVKLCQDFSTPSQYMLGGYAKGGSLTDEPTAFIQPSFSAYSSDQLNLIFNLSKKTGGKSNLYDAVNGAIDKFSSVTSSKKSIIVLAHANDEGSASALNYITTKAAANQVQVHVLVLGNLANASNLSKLAEATGGLFVVCPSIGELMATLENLYLVLGGYADVYRIKVKFQPTGGGIASGQEYWFPIKVRDPLYKIDYNSIVTYVKVP